MPGGLKVPDLKAIRDWCKDNFSNQNATAINLISYPYTSSNYREEKTIDGITETYDKIDGGITFTGTASSNYVFDFSYRKTLGENENYIFHAGLKTSIEGLLLGIIATRIENNTAIQKNIFDEKEIVFTTEEETTYGCFLRIEKGTTVNVKLYPMLEKGNVAHDFIKYIAPGDRINEVLENVKDNIQETPITITALSETVDQAIAGMGSGSKLKDLMSHFKAFASGAKTLINACVTTGMITQQNVNNQDKVPSAALLYALNKSLTDSVSAINSNMSKKAETANLPRGFRNINTNIASDNNGKTLDMEDIGWSVYAGIGNHANQWYYFTFYAYGNNNKSNGLQIAFPGLLGNVPQWRIKFDNSWYEWQDI